ncbi:hypothetical protein FKW77_010261 [Venturia effusa]|uniref:Arabinan endo-1,5-alpha-L-arabinosidase n=1 Tax=Venturia effusa TaxID=50376 RepID=A0A517L4E5_9PEZI|nr:hypothetical protein FKW77_010261 [Venturia effusa]
MLSFLYTLSLSFLALSDVIHARHYATPSACSGVCGNSHDPSVIRRHSDGKLFRFSTGNRISVATASHLSGPWVAMGCALPAGSKINKKGRHDLWAPDVSRWGDTYYLLYSVSSFGSQDSAIGYATSKDLESWTDHGSTGIESSKGKDYNAIDGHMILTRETHYIAFGSFWSDIFITSLTFSDTGAFKSSSSSAKQIAFTSVVPQAVEGASVFMYSGHWYLLFSAGQCCGLDKNRPPSGKEYQIKVCRSRKPNSGYEDKSGRDCRDGGGTTLLASHGWVYAPGGQGVLQNHTEGPFLYYHYGETLLLLPTTDHVWIVCAKMDVVDTRIGYADGQKKFGWNKLIFGKDGWPTV